jgi:uncharacterized protein YbdZ (MbtH family)
MKGKNKPISLIFISLLVLSTLVIVYTPTVRSGSFKETGQRFYGTLTPQIVSEGYEGKSVKFQFTLTSNTTVTYNITEVEVTAPSGWTITGAECNSTWTASIASPPTKVTFTNNTAEAMLSKGTCLLFNITATVKVGRGTWTIACSEKETNTGLGSATKDVLVAPYFKAEISPSVVKSGSTYTFNLKVTHNTTLSSIYMVNVTYPTTGKWSYVDLVAMPDYWTIYSHDPAKGIIVLEGTGGHFIAPGQSATFSFKMALASGASDGMWSVTCINTAMQNATSTLKVEVDDVPPLVSIISPSLGRVSGAVWINASITEPHFKEWSIKINGTQVQKGTTIPVSYKWITTNYPDASYVINITATDVVGNIGFDTVTVEVDNTPPILHEIKVRAYNGGTLIGSYTPIGNTIWIPNATGIQVNATFLDAGTISGYIYFNITKYDFRNKQWLPEAPYDISRITSLPLKINITDDQGNRFVYTWYVKKDFNPPRAPTYTRFQLICGGIIIWGINATDAESFVVGYNVYINKSREYIATDELASKEWNQFDTHLYAFSGVLVVDLTGAQWAKITVEAVDGAGNVNASTIYAGEIPKGTWYPLQLQPKWNLVSLPLIPNSTSTAAIYSLILKQGPAGVTVTYGFNNTAKTWIINPTTMTDGKGYWIYMKAYDVLIVQGLPTPEPPALPTTYHLPAGWCLVGFTETQSMNASRYVESLEPGSYFRWLYVWNATTQSWSMVDTKPATSGKLYPGQAFWIYMYKDQDLVPPISD